jgi:adenylate kinase family enzyme
LSKKIHEELNLPCFELDDVFWEKKYTVKRSEDNKKKLLSKIINKNDKWIIEGIFNNLSQACPLIFLILA